MGQVALSTDQYKRLTALIENRAGISTVTERQMLLADCDLNEFQGRLLMDANAHIFSSQLVRALQDYGTLKRTGKPALVSLLTTLRDRVEGQEEDAQFVDDLLLPYSGTPQAASTNPVAPTTPVAAATASSDDKVGILFLSANPRGTDRLRLDEEARTIEERLREGKYRDRFDLKTAWALRWTDLSRYLMEFQPRIVHFSGHGASSSELVLESASGEPQVIPADSLSDLFRILKNNVRCVVLNACWSANQAAAISDHIDCVVGMIQPVNDSAAVHFAGGFYRSLGFGYSVQTAFDLGKNEVSATLPDGKDIPQLICRAGVDASTVKF